ncbi:MAG: aminotransferase class I/II-fold pyridoxal phosphate-dependent enzyme, partial [Pseudomonadota bacterium]
VKADGDYRLNVEGLIAAGQKPETKIVFICSPNNPTATSFDAGDIQAVIDGCAGHAVVVLDETYIEMAEAQSLTKKIEEHPHLIVLRTLSKSYSMAGLRMGALISGDTDFIELIRTKALRVYPLPVPVVRAVLAAFDGPIHEQGATHIETLLGERARLEAAFGASDKVVHVFPSDANFLFVEFKDPAAYMQACAEQDIILRDFSADPATQNCIRITVGMPEQNDLLIEILDIL